MSAASREFLEMRANQLDECVGTQEAILISQLLYQNCPEQKNLIDKWAEVVNIKCKRSNEMSKGKHESWMNENPMQ